MTTTDNLRGLLLATANERREAEARGDADAWVIAHIELDRLLELLHAARADHGEAPVLA